MLTQLTPDDVRANSKDLVEALLEKATNHDVVWQGLTNALVTQGYFVFGADGRWLVQKDDGLMLSPNGGYHSFEDALTAIFEDVKALQMAALEELD